MAASNAAAAAAAARNLVKLITSRYLGNHAGDGVDVDYEELEGVGPAPYRADMAHGVMVRQGLCARGNTDAAVSLNRYSNIIPYDAHLFPLAKGTSGKGKKPAGDEAPYINASCVTACAFPYVAAGAGTRHWLHATWSNTPWRLEGTADPRARST